MQITRRKLLSISGAGLTLLLTGCTKESSPMQPKEFIANLNIRHLTGLSVLNALGQAKPIKKFDNLNNNKLIREPWLSFHDKKKLNNRINNRIKKDFEQDKTTLVNHYLFSNTEIKLYQYIIKNDNVFFDSLS